MGESESLSGYRTVNDFIDEQNPLDFRYNSIHDDPQAQILHKT